MLHPNWRTFAHHSSSGSSYYSGPYFRLFVRVPNSRGDSKWMLINREDVSTTHDLSPLYPEKSRQAFPLDIQPSRPFRHFFLHRDPGNFMVIMRPQAVTENATRRGGTRWDEHQQITKGETAMYCIISFFIDLSGLEWTLMFLNEFFGDSKAPSVCPPGIVEISRLDRLAKTMDLTKTFPASPRRDWNTHYRG